MVLLGPLQISLYGGWRWWRGRGYIRRATLKHAETQTERGRSINSTIDYGNGTLAPSV